MWEVVNRSINQTGLQASVYEKTNMDFQVSKKPLNTITELRKSP